MKVKLGSGQVGQVGLSSTRKGLDIYDKAAVERVVSAIVARYVKQAKDMIENATVGIFP